MADLDFEFNAEEHASEDSFDPIPDGNYPARVEKADYGQTKNGKAITIQWRVVGADYPGRVIFDRLNIKNASEKCQKIGLESFSRLCKAVGVKGVKNTDVLLEKEALLRVRTEHSEGYDPKNVVKGYKKSEGAGPVAQAAPKASTQQVPWG